MVSVQCLIILDPLQLWHGSENEQLSSSLPTEVATGKKYVLADNWGNLFFLHCKKEDESFHWQQWVSSGPSRSLHHLNFNQFSPMSIFQWFHREISSHVTMNYDSGSSQFTTTIFKSFKSLVKSSNVLEIWVMTQCRLETWPITGFHQGHPFMIL